MTHHQSREERLEDFGQEIRRRRESLGLTLEELASRSSLTPNFIGTIEKGSRDPSLSTLFSLAQGFGIEPPELLGYVHGVSPAALEAARLFELTAPPVRKVVLALLRVLRRRA